MLDLKNTHLWIKHLSCKGENSTNKVKRKIVNLKYKHITTFPNGLDWFVTKRSVVHVKYCET